MNHGYGKPPLGVRLGILAGLLLVMFGVPVTGLLWMTAVPGRSWQGPLRPLDEGGIRLAERLRRHVKAIASAPHNVAHPEALEQSARYLERTLISLGYRVRRQSFPAGGTRVRNIEAVVEPADARAPTLVVGAHYDSYGDAPGANDNATGAAAVLELARALRPLSGRSRLRLRLVLFVNEEPPFFKTDAMGSRVYARAIKASGERVLGMISLETMGYYSDSEGSQHYPAPFGAFYPSKGDFVAFVATTGSRAFLRRTVAGFRAVADLPSVGGTGPGFLQGIDWSDHWAFEQAGVPALMITDTAPFRYPFYHSPADTPDQVDYPRLARVVSGLARLLRRWSADGSP
jgi:Peptidase family M28